MVGFRFGWSFWHWRRPLAQKRACVAVELFNRAVAGWSEAGIRHMGSNSHRRRGCALVQSRPVRGCEQASIPQPFRICAFAGIGRIARCSCRPRTLASRPGCGRFRLVGLRSWLFGLGTIRRIGRAADWLGVLLRFPFGDQLGIRPELEADHSLSAESHV